MDEPVYQDEIYITEIPFKPTHIISSKLALFFCSRITAKISFTLEGVQWWSRQKDPQNPKESWFVLILEKGNARKCILNTFCLL